jgi:hypothetical protein
METHMRFFLLVTILLSISFAQAARLEISNTTLVKAERWHQLEALFYHDDGQVENVTIDTDFSASGYQEMSNGNFYFSLPAFNSGYSFTVPVSASYLSGDGLYYHASTLINVDAVPDWIQISGSYFVNSGWSQTYTAYGIYGGKRIDLSRQGEWSSFRGQINGWGTYYAPKITNGQTITDTITFRFGFKSERMTISIR